MPSGYVKACNRCGKDIYLHLDGNGEWRPYESWFAGNAAEGEWIPHQCSAGSNANPSLQQLQAIFTQVMNAEPVPPSTPVAEDLNEPSQPERIEQKVYRILRDTALARKVKVAHSYQCQLCGDSLRLSNDTPYAEAHHVKPLGSPHNGPDVEKNIVCVCPNCHVLLDYGAVQLDPSKFRDIDAEYIAYHNTTIYGRGQH